MSKQVANERLTREEIEELLKLGERATARPWVSLPSILRPQFGTKINQILASGGPAIVTWSGFDNSDVPFKQHKANAAYIAAACNMAVPLATQLADAERKLAELQRENLNLRCEMLEAYKQLEYWWQSEHRCPCGARPESPHTHSHVTGCPTGKAVEVLKELET